MVSTHKLGRYGATLIFFLSASTWTSSDTPLEHRFLPSIFLTDESSRHIGSSRNVDFSNTTAPEVSSAHSSACELESSCMEAIHNIDWEATKMFLELRYLSNERNINEFGIHVSHAVGLISRISSAQKHIDSLICHIIESTSAGSSTSSFGTQDFGYLVSGTGSEIFSRLCAVAGSMYIHLFLLQTPVEKLAAFDWMIDFLKSEMKGNPLIIRQLCPLERVFWILCVAGCAAIRRRMEKSCIADRLAGIRIDLQLETWDEAKSVLKKITWVELSNDSLGENLWLELNNAR